MLRTARSLPPTGLLTLGFDPTRFQTEPPACYRASWQLPGPDSHRQATTSLCQITITSSTSDSGRTPRNRVGMSESELHVYEDDSPEERHGRAGGSGV